ncbi:kinase-like domain-containing protein [Halteromyces radiatus]|uniref:kinase-like domain-containing protein n=1 Tax=Halteromyces radiatus TaxID=101107 RepID=UPI00221EB047|nr:kinase-like domain-containing protein [Halteromyces radiatus]KAI8100168.1 kinase-like domain-containing protein [Halteromyces radiatus]
MLAKGPLRKKRNFKNLKLSDSPVVASPSTTSTGDKNGHGGNNNIKDDYGKVCNQLNDLEIGLELRLDLRPEDFDTVDELGRGNGGTVCKVLHVRTQTVMARKIIHIQANSNVRKQIMREMQFLHDCNSKHIVSYYGAFMQGDDISICMEYMEVGSLDAIYKRNGPIPLPVLKKIAYAIVDGLIYLYEAHRIIHRDLKPSNVLVNSQGQIKLCDFGVSGQLINSVADTFVGTSSYMSPERIRGSPYTIQSDVWSLGITIMELALARFPFPADGTPLSIFELLQHIVNEPVPTFPPNKYPKDLTSFVEQW